MKRFYPQLDLKLIFKNSFSVGSFFRFKDRLPPSVLSNVVYKYSCAQCNAACIGETTRHLKTSIAEHRGLSNRTGLPISNPPNSTIRDHALKFNHTIDFSNFKIIHSCRPFDIKIAESILIDRHKPDLNSMDFSVPLNIIC